MIQMHSYNFERRQDCSQHPVLSPNKFSINCLTKQLFPKHFQWKASFPMDPSKEFFSRSFPNPTHTYTYTHSFNPVDIDKGSKNTISSLLLLLVSIYICIITSFWCYISSQSLSLSYRLICLYYH
jgi:hypothetical protein